MTLIPTLTTNRNQNPCRNLIPRPNPILNSCSAQMTLSHLRPAAVSEGASVPDGVHGLRSRICADSQARASVCLRIVWEAPVCLSRVVQPLSTNTVFHTVDTQPSGLVIDEVSVITMFSNTGQKSTNPDSSYCALIKAGLSGEAPGCLASSDISRAAASEPGMPLAAITTRLVLSFP